MPEQGTDRAGEGGGQGMLENGLVDRHLRFLFLVHLLQRTCFSPIIILDLYSQRGVLGSRLLMRKGRNSTQ